MFLMVAFWLLGILGQASADTFPGGRIEPQGQFQRTKLTAGQIAAFIPANRAPFTFPEIHGYGTAGVKLTQNSDCSNQDCLFYVGYSYWANMNNHVNSDFIRIFLNFSTSFGGDGPNQIIYDKLTGNVFKNGPLFPDGSPWRSTGEGSTTWYWSGTMPTHIYMIDYVGTGANPQRKFFRYDILSLQHELVFDLSLAAFPLGCSVSNCPFRLWQAHSSKDDTVHSFTIRDNSNNNLGCLIYQPNRSPNTRWYPKQSGNGMDECDIDLSGHYTLIRELTNPSNDTTRINRYIDNWTAQEFQITNFANTIGHHAGGFNYFIGSGDPENLPGSIFYYLMNPFGRGAVQHYDNDWPMNTMNHPSHLNSFNGGPLANQMFCGSNMTTDNIRNEIICSRMDNSHRDLIVAPVMTNANASGGRFGRGVGEGNFGLFPKGNIDITGRYFVWTSNHDSNRLDAFLVKIPSQQFGGETDIHPPATPSIDVARVSGAQLTPAPRGFTLTFYEAIEAAMLLWSAVKYRAKLLWAYRLAGQKAFQYYWQWKVKRWLKDAPVMIADNFVTIQMEEAHGQVFIRHAGHSCRHSG
jgi:hypothetical protein